jgi:hypothetical protein
MRERRRACPRGMGGRPGVGAGGMGAVPRLPWFHGGNERRGDPRGRPAGTPTRYPPIGRSPIRPRPRASASHVPACARGAVAPPLRVRPRSSASHVPAMRSRRVARSHHPAIPHPRSSAFVRVPRTCLRAWRVARSHHPAISPPRASAS